MAIPLYGSVGSLFNRLGKLGQAVKQVKSYQASQLINLTDTTAGIVAQLNAESDIQAQIGNNYINQLNSPGSAIGSLMQQMAVAVANRMTFRDSPRINQNLQSQNTLAALQEIIYQMGQQGATVLAMAVTATTTAFQGTGNGTLLISTKRASDGRTVENAYSETLQVVCSADSYLGNATAGNEGFTLTGEGSSPTAFDFDWPLGSNCTAGLNAIDGSVDNGSGNLLVNSGFDSWTGNTPDNWTITVGAAGTQILKEVGIVFSGAASLALVGSGGVLTSWQQAFNSSSGTSDALEPLTQYGFNVWLRRDGTVPGAGQLAVELVNGGGVVINDAAGVANQTLIDLTALTTSFVPNKIAFRTPEILPSTYSIRYRLTAGNALTNGRTVYIDLGALGTTTAAYSYGPSAAVFSGPTPFTQGAFATSDISNSRGAGGTLSTFQTLLLQLFQTPDLLFPSSNVPSVSDQLIA